uniref:RNA helicase n=1 Tax=Pinguiococcus pyrenoidosus TaxID=172671 RepID=A0A7R9UEK9_9STRA
MVAQAEVWKEAVTVTVKAESAGRAQVSRVSGCVRLLETSSPLFAVRVNQKKLENLAMQQISGSRTRLSFTMSLECLRDEQVPLEEPEYWYGVIEMEIRTEGSHTAGGQTVSRFLKVKALLSTRSTEAAFKLSVEAKPFFPLNLRQCFDTPVAAVVTADRTLLNAPPEAFDVERHAAYFDIPPRVWQLWSIHQSFMDRSRPSQKALQEGASSPPEQRTALELEVESFSATERFVSVYGQKAFDAKYLANRVAFFLFLEEAQSKCDVYSFDQFNVQPRLVRVRTIPSSKPSGTPVRVPIVQLKVPGLMENRPALCFGDEVRFRPATAMRSMRFPGEVRGLVIDAQPTKGMILVQLPSIEAMGYTFAPPSANGVGGSSEQPLEWHVRFSYSRTPYCLMHKATANHVGRMSIRLLYPNESHVRTWQEYEETGMTNPDAVSTLAAMKLCPLAYGRLREVVSLAVAAHNERREKKPISVTEFVSLARPKMREERVPFLSAYAAYFATVLSRPIDWTAHGFHLDWDGGFTTCTVDTLLSVTTVACLPAQEVDPAARVEETLANKALNEKQLQAVTDILRRSSGVAPYLIFGPPGTGKTMTLVEAVMQLFIREPQSRILCTASSDAAADILAGRLLKYLEAMMPRSVACKTIFRMNWWRRNPASLPPNLLRISSQNKHGVFDFVPLRNLSRAPMDGVQGPRIIVSTAAASEVLNTLLGSQKAFFSHVVADECSQCLEPELLIPLQFASNMTSVVLCGDPRQLGSALRCSHSRRGAFDVSLQERLMKHCAVYHNPEGFVQDLPPGWAPWRGRRRTITTLEYNYRSHESIIRLASAMFYDGQLVAKGDSEVTGSMLGFRLRNDIATSSIIEDPKRQAALMWLGCAGEHAHEVDSPSFFNVVEATSVLRLIKRLLSSEDVSVSPSDIGVICAFRRQTLLVRKLLRKDGLGAVNVGSCEDFQGNEKRIVIVSLTLTHSPGPVTVEDKAAREPQTVRMGLFGDPKKFNVSTTRAKALCVVVGEPRYAATDPCWRNLLHMCVLEKNYSGREFWIEGDEGFGYTPAHAYGDGDDEAGAILDRLGSLALGYGDAVSMFPRSLEGFYQEEAGWRVLM